LPFLPNIKTIFVTIQPFAVGRAARAINGLARFTHAPEKARVRQGSEQLPIFQALGLEYCI